MISLDAVSKKFDERTAVDNISLDIEQAERVVIFGPSGCGKTTLLRLIAGLIAPDSGRIMMGGEVVSGSGRVILPPEQRNLGFVFQDLAHVCALRR